MPSLSPLSLALVVCTLSAPARAADPDPWFGADKGLHYGVSAGLSASGYAFGAALFEPPAVKWVAGAGLSLGAGIAKELWDLSGRGHASWKDVTWNVLGTATGLVLSYFVERWLFPPSTAARPQPASATF